MKAPLITTGLLLACGLLWSWQEHRRFRILHNDFNKLASESISFRVPAPHSTLPPITVEQFTDQLSSLSQAVTKSSEAGAVADDPIQLQYTELMDRLLAFNGEELNRLIIALPHQEEIGRDEKSDVIGLSMILLAQKSPEMALAIYAGSSETKNNPIGRSGVRVALSQWARSDPKAALDWIQRNRTEFPDGAREAVIRGAARTDLSQALQLLVEVKFDHQSSLDASCIIENITTQEKQTAFLGALRRQIEKTSDPKVAKELQNSGLSELFSDVISTGYENATLWSRGAELTKEERLMFVRTIGYAMATTDTKKWLDWLADQPIGSEIKARITNSIVHTWTENDYLAAGEWLAHTRQGPARDRALHSYIMTVALFDPGVATHYVELLPSDQQKGVYRYIRSTIKDAAAASLYDTLHGLSS